MLEKNKKFRVIEEGVMNQGEMGVIKGGHSCGVNEYFMCIKKYEYGSCEKDISYLTPCYPYDLNPCDGYAKPCPDVEVYHICPGQNTYLNYCCPSILPE